MSKKKPFTFDESHPHGNNGSQTNAPEPVFNPNYPDFEVHDPKTDGTKLDGAKAPWHLLPMQAVEKIVEVMGYGAAKYGEFNWTKLKDFEKRYFSACMRHLKAWQSGEKLDPESGLSHLAHAACNLIFLIYKELDLMPWPKDTSKGGKALP